MRWETVSWVAHRRSATLIEVRRPNKTSRFTKPNSCLIKGPWHGLLGKRSREQRKVWIFMNKLPRVHHPRPRGACFDTSRCSHLTDPDRAAEVGEARPLAWDLAFLHVVLLISAVKSWRCSHLARHEITTSCI
jgi:hypothetical protein